MNLKLQPEQLILQRFIPIIAMQLTLNHPPEKREEDGKKLALWNSSNYLELAIYKSNPSTVGSASTLFGLEFRDTITVNFN